jgi:uncharacterized phage protein (TIGR02218 family)
MKSASTEMIQLLAMRQFIMADLFTFTTTTETLRYTSADRDLTNDDGTFLAGKSLIKRNQIRSVVGVEVDSLNVTMYISKDTLIGDLPVSQFVQNGGLDGAIVKLERAIMPSWGNMSAGTLTMFTGRVADISVSASQLDLIVNSDLELLNINLPRNVYQAGCLHSLYDSGCGLNRNLFDVIGEITGASTRFNLVTDLSEADDYFTLGTLEFLDGPNDGVRRTIKSYTSGEIVPSFPLPYVPEVGNQIRVLPGCDKLKATCFTKFNNLASFRGFPFIPVPEASY